MQRSHDREDFRSTSIGEYTSPYLVAFALHLVYRASGQSATSESIASLGRWKCRCSTSNLLPSTLLKLPTRQPPSISPLPPVEMAPVPSSAGSALRAWTRHALPTSQSSCATARLAATSQTAAPQTALSQRRYQQTASTSSFDSPFRENRVDSNKIPSFKAYRAKSPEVSNRVFQYFMVGSMGLLAAAGAKATVQGMVYR
jgi:hypothetical protein